MSLHARIAAALGWSEKDAQSFSLLTLRELLREKHPKLAAEITETVRSGRNIIGEPLKKGARRG